MRWFSIIAIYVLFWWLTLFAVLPWGLRTLHEDKSAKAVPGQAESAPVNFRPWRVMVLTTLISLALFALFCANWIEGWVTFADIDYTRRVVGD